jgi:hypothetical protein
VKDRDADAAEPMLTRVFDKKAKYSPFFIDALRQFCQTALWKPAAYKYWSDLRNDWLGVRIREPRASL